jgi:hypothetical protein
MIQGLVGGQEPAMETGELTQERIALNQATFRDANERIDSAAEGMALDGDVPFICECPDRACVEIVHLRLEAYRGVRENPRRFFNAPGHERASVGAGAAVVVETLPGYVVLDKIGEAGEIVEALDRRGPPDG